MSNNDRATALIASATWRIVLRGQRLLSSLGPHLGYVRADDSSHGYRAVIATLTAHRAELQSIGGRSLALAGSFARGEARPDSDVDLNAELPAGRSLFDDIHLEQFLEELLGRSVDLIPLDYRIGTRIRAGLEADAIRVV